MKFAIIGWDSVNSVERKLEKALKKLGHTTYFLSRKEIKTRYCQTVFKSNYHLTQKYPIDLREILPYEQYDMIIIGHMDFTFLNPKVGSTKIFYIHREALGYPSCMNPDILAYNDPKLKSYIWHYYPQLNFGVKNHIDFDVAVDPEEFNPNRKKDLDGLNYVSLDCTPKLHYHRNMEESLMGAIWDDNDKKFIEREKLFTSNGCRYNGDKFASFDAYKDFMERSEAFLIFTDPSLLGSRRVMEAAACQTLPIIHIENIESELYYNRLGFINKLSCLMFKEYPKPPNSYSSDELKLSKNAYEIVLQNHTYDHRAKQILEILK